MRPRRRTASREKLSFSSCESGRSSGESSTKDSIPFPNRMFWTASKSARSASPSKASWTLPGSNAPRLCSRSCSPNTDVQFAAVTPQYERISSSNAVLLIFRVEEGPRVRVGKIAFSGNHVFSDRKLVRAMRHDRPYAIPLYFTELSVFSKAYDREKLNED